MTPRIGGADPPLRHGYTLADFAGNAIISIVMSGVMSAVMIAANAGFGTGYIRTVAFSWLIGSAVSFPTALMVVPPVIRWQSRRIKGRSIDMAHPEG